MATYRVGANIPVRWAEFSNHDGNNTVRAYYRVGAASPVLIGNLDNSYATAVDGNADERNRHQADIEVVEGMLGENVVIIIRDSTEDDIEIEATDGDTIVTDVATQAVISPSAATIRIGTTRQFTVTFYAADDGATNNHDAPMWSTNAPAGVGSINASTGLFTASDTAGGPYVVTATAGAVTDTAGVSVIEFSGVKPPVMHRRIGVGVGL